MTAGSVETFAGEYPFSLDAFQRQALASLDAGRDVLVAAPTGSGKTVVGEYAVHAALRDGGKCFYTTPIKALSNQKYVDLCARHGDTRVGLLTGDVSVNGEAPVVVMTTEVLRNMLYASSPTLVGLRSVVMDEVHYLADRERGPVWEEVIIGLPESVRLVSLSATVSNAEEVGDWLGTVRGATDVVVSEHRPVPLWQHVMVGASLHDLFVDEAQQRVNPDLVRLAREDARRDRRRPAKGPKQVRQSTARRHHTPRRAEVVARLQRSDLLPAIVFVFSRAGCDAAVEQVLRDGIALTDAAERAAIDATVADVESRLPADDQAALGFHAWRRGLRAGVAAHHAGQLPMFKQTVEALFSRGLVKVVYATETLALGINMPARCVVLERLVKWNGEQHADVTAGEYTQLTGRAGRRGIDTEGHAVVVWHQGLDPTELAGLASTRTYPLRSSFRPSYNMAVNLVHQVGRRRARRLLESSFAQFQTDRSAVALASRRTRLAEAVDGYRQALQCERGDIAEYMQMRRTLSTLERDRARQRRSERDEARALQRSSWRVGDVISIPAGRSKGLAVVLARAAGAGPHRRSGAGPARPLVLTENRQVRRLAAGDLRHDLPVVARVRVPKGFDASPPARRALVSRMRDAARTSPDRHQTPHQTGDGTGHGTGQGTGDRPAVRDSRVDDLRRDLTAHPCHECPDREEHARWAERLWQAEREHDRLVAGLQRRSGSIAAAFDRVCAVLDALDYTNGDTVTPDGQRLRSLFGDLDLLAAESIRRRVWDGLTAAELAACVSALTYTSRSDDHVAILPPTGPAREALTRMEDVASELRAIESDHHAQQAREPDLGFARAAYRWTSGHSLAAVLAEAELSGGVSAGDFVRAMRQVIDMLSQVAVSADEPVAATARQAVSLARRGVVGYEEPG